MKNLVTILVIMTLLLSCKHDEKTAFNDKVEFKKAEAAAKALENAAQDDCSCMTQAQIDACPDNSGTSVIRQYIPAGNTHSVYTITWHSCLNSQSSDPYCNTPYGSTEFQTTVDLCWFDCSTVTAKFTGKPPCLPCYPENFCLQLKPVKTVNGGTTTYELAGSYQGSSSYEGVNLHLQVVVSTDPDITMMCTTNPGTSSEQVYTCYGSF